MGIFDMMSISASELSAERQRAEVISANMANAETTHTDSGGPYVRKEVIFGATNGSIFHSVLNGLRRFSYTPAGSVQLTQVVDDPTPPVDALRAGQSGCGRSGFVAYPAINPVKEMADLIGSVRAYQLNASAVTLKSKWFRNRSEF